MDIETMYLAIGLIVLIIVNIILGSLNALFTSDFDRKKFYEGILKGSVVVLCFIATYYVGFLNPDIIAIQVNDIEVNVITGVYLIVLSGYYYYAKQVFDKLSNILKGNIAITNSK